MRALLISLFLMGAGFVALSLRLQRSPMDLQGSLKKPAEDPSSLNYALSKALTKQKTEKQK